MPYIGTPPASELANLDINGQKFILDADADTHITADTDDQIDIAIAGADDFQFTANTFTVSTGSRLFAPDGTGALPSIALGASRNSGMYTTGDGNIALTASGGLSGSGHEMRFLGNGTLHIDDSANGSMTTGLTINQGAQDNEILALKSSDITHGATSITETDTFMSVLKGSATNGGAWFEFLSDTGQTGGTVTFNCTGGQPDTAVGTNRAGLFRIRGASHDGSNSLADLSANGHIVSVESRRSGSIQTCFLIDEDGDTHADGSHNDTAFDDYDDVALLSASRHVTHKNKNFAKRIYGDFIQEHAQVLHDNGVITMNDDGHHFVSTKGMNGLIIDAIRQTRNIQKAFYNILSDEQKNKFAGEIEEMKLPVLPAFQTP